MFPGKTILWLVLMALGTATLVKLSGVPDWPILLAALDGYVFGRLIQIEAQKGKS